MMQLPSECWIKLFLKANLLENWFDFLRNDVAMKIWVAFAIMVIFYHKANKIKCCIYFNPRWNDLTCEKPGESSDKFGLSFVSNWLTGWNEFFFYQSHSIVKHCLSSLRLLLTLNWNLLMQSHFKGLMIASVSFVILYFLW